MPQFGAYLAIIIYDNKIFIEQATGGRNWQLIYPHCACFQWEGINRKQSTRWQHLSQLKASAFFSLQKNF
jgi:hypothetical protein